MPDPQHNRPSNLPGEATPGPVFRLGIPGLSHETVEHGQRLFHWTLGQHDMSLAELAGWSKLPFTEHNGQGRLVLPRDVRSASSALAGAEAWPGEKDEIIHAITGYAQRVYAQAGVIDTNLHLDSVAVGRGNSALFMVPPHFIVHPEDDLVGTWHERLRDDVDAVLGNDPRRGELLAAFDVGLSFTGGHHDS